MLQMYTFIFASFCLSLLLLIVSISLSKKTNKDFDKMSPFECGFDPFLSSRMPFSMQFFTIAIIFLIFDVEITLIFPMIVSMFLANKMIWMMTMTMFMVTLFMGIIQEWFLGALNWKKC